MWFVMALSLMSCGSEIIDVDGGDLDVLVENEVQEFDATDDVDAADDTLREDLIDASFADGLSDEGGSCVPDCTDIECTPEPLCGYYVCGVCESRHECESGRCVFYSTWAQDQYNVECGDDGMCLVLVTCAENLHRPVTRRNTAREKASIVRITGCPKPEMPVMTTIQAQRTIIARRQVCALGRKSEHLVVPHPMLQAEASPCCFWDL